MASSGTLFIASEERTSIVDLPRAGINSLQKLIHLVIAHFLPQIRKNVSQLSNTNETRHILIEDLETTAIFFWFSRLAESTRTVEDFREGLEID
jgi:hypothetical protein